MELPLRNRLAHAWNAFRNKDPTYIYDTVGITSTYRPDRVKYTRGNERTIVTSIYNRLAVDASSITIEHIRTDENGRFEDVIDSDLNKCLTLEANKDQTAKAFIQDIVASMLDEGIVAVIPVDTSTNPRLSDSFKIHTMRTGKILQWRPNDIQVRAYNDETGNNETIWIPKNKTAIIENPFYAVMNEPNSTMQRLIHKLSILDAIDEQSGSGKLDMIIQLPYAIKTEGRRVQAEKRRKDIEDQLNNSKYGIAYTDGVEKIVQLNRAVENNLMSQIEYLTSMLYSQLGINQAIMDGTADEHTMTNYFNRTIEPIINAIVDEMKRKFLTKTARAQHQSIYYFRNPFSLIPVTQVADLADKLTRNEIATTNEIRGVIGLNPSADPNADVLRNKNINQSDQAIQNTVDVNGNPVDFSVPNTQSTKNQNGKQGDKNEA